MQAFFLYEQFYNNEAQIWPKIEQSRLGFGNIHAKFAFLIITFYYFSQTRLYRALNYSKLRSIEFPLRFSRLDDHK